LGMGVLLITCPATGKEFSTGLNVAKDALKRLPRNQEATAFCPYCKSEHKWRRRDARYVDAIPPGDWIENQ
jgi:hypothetical protein